MYKKDFDFTKDYVDYLVTKVNELLKGTTTVYTITVLDHVLKTWGRPKCKVVCKVNKGRNYYVLTRLPL